MRAAWLVLVLAAPPESGAATELAGAAARDEVQESSPEVEAGGESSAAVVAEAGPAEVDSKERARVAFGRGNELAVAGRYAEAAAAFAESDAAFPSPNAAYNAAYANEKAESWVDATRGYRDYLARYADGEWRGEVAQSLGRLSTKIADLEVKVRGDLTGEAVVWIDGAAVGPDTVSLIRRPGPVRIEVRDAQEGVLETRRLDLYPGSANIVTIELVAADVGGDDGGDGDGDGVEGDEGDEGDGDGDRSPDRPPRPWLKGAAIASGAVTAGAGIGIAAAGVLTLGARERYEAAICPTPCMDGSYPFGEERTFMRTRTATNALIGITTALGVVTTGLVVAALVERRRVRVAAEAERERGANRGAGRGADREPARVRLSPRGLIF